MIKPRIEGTLEQKLNLLENTHHTIIELKERIKKDTEDIQTQLKKGRELETGINMHLLNGGRSNNPILDYCFNHFGGNSSDSSDTVFDIVPRVSEFLSYVEKNKGGKILTVHGNLQKTGVISGQGQFIVERKLRHLYLPVEKLLVLRLDEGAWSQEEENLIYINPDIFQFPSPDNEEGIWRTHHSNEFYTEETRKETFIYVGNSFVEKGLEEHPLPPRRQRISSIPY